MAKVARPLRFINIAFGLWLLLDADGAAAVNSAIVGVAVIGLSLPRGNRSAEHYGGWDRYIV
jgi:hypothetical protein